MRITHRIEQCRLALLVFGIDVCLGVQQQFHHLLIAAHRRRHQGGTLFTIDDIDVCIGRQQLPHDVDITAARCGDQSGITQIIGNRYRKVAIEIGFDHVALPETRRLDKGGSRLRIDCLCRIILGCWLLALRATERQPSADEAADQPKVKPSTNPQKYLSFVSPSPHPPSSP